MIATTLDVISDYLSVAWLVLFTNTALRAYHLVWLRVSVRGHVLDDLRIGFWSAVASIVLSVIVDGLRAHWGEMVYAAGLLAGVTALSLILRRVGKRYLFSPTVYRVQTIYAHGGAIVTTRDTGHRHHRYGHERRGRRRWYAPWSRYS